ncbi:hypothetical protein A4H97_34145 [Niastella yeongjuensis]|uniref:Uncharacterized protein n=1 Tax=Niastella yeongjuensis TaxID=354355 RepID=A0A1V9E7D6_9BACT|nr:hypothetical protein [Niastella yeongjuensis]OQP42030.1 hypothetical protein A4H97_34145 [Niastella yeongjuensis]SEP49206.1 hypothetical protein SAMN05660816_06908 [Niastella yeongjuensis]
MTIISIKEYFLARCDEIISLSHRGDPWTFLCGSAMIDYLTNMTTGNSTRVRYINFIEDYFAQVNILYKEFTYQSGDKDLPTQMYVVLRCGIVHSFSLIPNNLGISYGGRIRSILLAHEKNGHSHFETYIKDGMDSVIFTAEGFAMDIKNVVLSVFKKATTDQNLETQILAYVQSYPPILGRFS